uniref:Uncharacterized protein n=1 Tax=Aegilops tauschii subsp. strangulata TaxID=200361 RepID=A0A453EI78_AEGTS
MSCTPMFQEQRSTLFQQILSEFLLAYFIQCSAHLATGYDFDYVFDWTVLKYKQGQKTQHVPGATITRAIPTHLDKRAGVNGDVHPNEAHEQMESSHMTGSAAQLQVKLETERSLPYHASY